jgi:hypothetical protein
MGATAPIWRVADDARMPRDGFTRCHRRQTQLERLVDLPKVVLDTAGSNELTDW